MANRLSLDEVMARVVLVGDSDFSLFDGCSSEGEGEGFSAYSGEGFMASTDGEEEQNSEPGYNIKHKIECRSVLPGFLGTEQETPGYCVGQIVSITLQ